MSFSLPRGGFLLLVALTPILFLPQVWDLYTLPKECFVSLIVSLLIVVWAWGNISPRKSGIYLSPLGLPILVYFLALLFSLIHTINPYTGVYEVLRQLTYILLFFLVVNNIKDENPPSPPFSKGGLGGFSSEKDIAN
ncbi:MAG: hypothetical protein QMD03_09495, partial [Syntrophales bacterium]|nr:hypothetical protein [Syntrophales bacterium]